jgi:putative endonuclease
MARSWLCRLSRSDSAAEAGRRAERAAARYLVRQGLCLVARNVRVRVGEIDLVMTDGPELVFVEVRYRIRDDFGDGAATVGHLKQQRIIRAASHYLARRAGNDPPCRFDVVSVAGTPERLRFEWIRNAFEP